MHTAWHGTHCAQLLRMHSSACRLNCPAATCLPSRPLCVQYHILREKGTEPPGSGQYNKFYEDGTYKCAGCGTPLYK